mmetsp:Transcript_486/g.586  ORF Transcript_486/g.586 Transcript_486/m.586 type:complete len:94 (+) Transcript_486:99-380(+)
MVLMRCNLLTSPNGTNDMFALRSKPSETGSTTVHFNPRGHRRDLLAVDTAGFELVMQTSRSRTRYPAPRSNRTIDGLSIVMYRQHDRYQIGRW